MKKIDARDTPFLNEVKRSKRTDISWNAQGIDFEKKIARERFIPFSKEITDWDVFDFIPMVFIADEDIC